MPTGTSFTDGEVRSVFAMRAEGKQIKQIASTMDTTGPVISRILNRKTYKNVAISANVLAMIEKHGFRGYKKAKKAKHVVTGGVSLDKLNPAMPQAMRKADPQYKAAAPPPEPPPAQTRMKFENGEYQLTSKPPKFEDVPMSKAHAKLTHPVKLVGNTKAQALMDVLASVQHCNELRQEVEALRLKAVRLESLAKTKEDAAFARLSALAERGFSPEFLSSLLSESGLCSDGKFNVE